MVDFIVLSIQLVFSVLGVSYSRVLAQRPTGCCSASIQYIVTGDTWPTRLSHMAYFVGHSIGALSCFFLLSCLCLLLCWLFVNTYRPLSIDISSPTLARTHEWLHPRTHTPTNVHTRAHTPAHTHSMIHLCKPERMRTTCTHAPTRMHTSTQTHALTRTNVCRCIGTGRTCFACSVNNQNCQRKRSNNVGSRYRVSGGCKHDVQDVLPTILPLRPYSHWVRFCSGF